MQAFYFTSGSILYKATGQPGAMEEAILKLNQAASPNTGEHIQLVLPRNISGPSETIIYDAPYELRWRCFLVNTPTSWASGTGEILCSLIAATAHGKFTLTHTEERFIEAWKIASKKIASALSDAASGVAGVSFEVSPGGMAPAFLGIDERM
jgi:hypothetical protein